jgi:cytochrome c oxidase assembly protein subunit 15
MDNISRDTQLPIAAWHRNLLITAAIFTVLLIAMGGVLCVTQSIRSCPDWPGCFGKIIPPLETSPILEYTHRLLAGSSGLLILAAAIAGLLRARGLRWIMIPPLIACVLVVEVSYFGFLAVLYGISAGWAAVDLGSALLVVALIITSAVIAHARRLKPTLPDRLTYRSPFARLVLATVVVVYGVLVSGVLVAGPNSVTGCLGWPIYSVRQVQMDLPGAGNIIRLSFSILGILLMIAVLAQIWRSYRHRPTLFRPACWLGAAFLFEILLQVLMLIFGFMTPLLVAYAVDMAVVWGLLLVLGVYAGIEADLN